MAGPRANRVDVILACTECKARNYKTTKKKGTQDKLALKKFCKKCGQHTVHKETK